MQIAVLEKPKSIYLLMLRRTTNSYLHFTSPVHLSFPFWPGGQNQTSPLPLHCMYTCNILDNIWWWIYEMFLFEKCEYNLSRWWNISHNISIQYFHYIVTKYSYLNRVDFLHWGKHPDLHNKSLRVSFYSDIIHINRTLMMLEHQNSDAVSKSSDIIWMFVLRPLLKLLQQTQLAASWLLIGLLGGGCVCGSVGSWAATLQLLKFSFCLW